MDNDMNKLKLLADQPLVVDGVPIFSPKLKDIAKIGKSQYEKYVVMFAMPDKMFKEPIEKINNFELIIGLMLKDKEFHNDIIKAVKFFTRLDFEVSEFNSEVVLLNESKTSTDSGILRVISESNYKEIAEAVIYSNCFEIKDDSDGLKLDGLDEETRRMIERANRVKKGMKKEESNVGLSDIISSVANMDNGLNIIDIFNINKFTLMEQLQRGQAKEQYEIEIQSLLIASSVGADTKNVKVESYIRQL